MTTLPTYLASFLTFTPISDSSDSLSFTYSLTLGYTHLHTQLLLPITDPSTWINPDSSFFSVLVSRLHMLLLWEKNYTARLIFTFSMACCLILVSDLNCFIIYSSSPHSSSAHLIKPILLHWEKTLFDGNSHKPLCTS